MVIARLRAKGKNAVVEFDNGDALTIAQEVITAFVLFKGKDLSEEQYAELAAEQEYRTAMTIASRFLAYRARSEREVRDKLGMGKISPTTTARAIARLRETGVLDDSDFGGKFVHDALLKKPVGHIRLRQELRRKGIDDGAIDRALAERYDAQHEIEAACMLASKRMRKITGEDTAAQRAAVSRYLLSRGFSREAIDSAVADLDSKLDS